VGRVVQAASPPAGSLAVLREAARTCTACPLYRNATQTVFGEGRPSSRLVLVGEQPGDAEDVAGRPFVGPAGKLLDEVLAGAGIPREQVYVTNAVKHFKWEPRGKRRMHKTPAQREVEACLQWLEGEIDAVQPGLIVCLGATAAKALLGSGFRITVDRGRIHRLEGMPPVMATFHPSFLLRLKGRPGEEEAHAQFVADLRKAARPVTE
jgi:uracil-DNA glycosylase family protein